MAQTGTAKSRDQRESGGCPAATGAAAMPQSTSRLSPGSRGKIPVSEKMIRQMPMRPKLWMRWLIPSGLRYQSAWWIKSNENSEEGQIGNLVQQALAHGHLEQQLERGHAVALEVLSVLVDIHAHKAAARSFVDAPSELQGVGDGFVLVLDGIVDAVAHELAELLDEFR